MCYSQKSRGGMNLEVETESVEIRKALLDRVKEYVEKYPVFYDSVEEFVETGVREELIKIRKMDGANK